MKKHIILWAVVLAALFVVAGIVCLFMPLPEETGAPSSAPPPSASASPPAPTAAPEPTAAPQKAESVPMPTTTPDEPDATPTPAAGTQKKNTGEAFKLKIKDRTISVAYGVDEATLDRTPGWLTTSASPGQDGMCVVYGHRNRTHLRVLEKVENGDTITAVMPDGTVYTYIVSNIQIYENTADMLLPTADGKTLVLVTCYPFRYSGSAPGKYVVLSNIQYQ